MTKPADHYATLGISPTSDDVVVKAAYKALMLKYHPDTNRLDDATRRAAAINAAFAVLGDPVKRRAYDREREFANKASSTPPPPPPSPPPPEPPAEADNQEVADPRPASSSKFKGWGISLALIVIFGVIRALAHSPPSQTAPSIEPPPPGLLSSSDATSPMVVPSDAMSGNDMMMANLTDASVPPALNKFAPLPGLDYRAIEDAAGKFASVLQEGGIAGARAYSEKCHASANAEPSWEKVDSCAAFDFAARYLDQSVASARGGGEYPYFAFQSDNQADSYKAVTEQSWSVPDRLSRIRKAVEPATYDAVMAGLAKRAAS